MFNFIETHFLTLILGLSLLTLLVAVAALWRRRKKHKYRLERDATGFWRYHKDTQFLKKSAYGKALQKERHGADEPKSDLSPEVEKKTIAVLTFAGDLRAKQHNHFAKLVDEIEINHEELAEVVVRVMSPGGMVSQYGHVLSQMERLRETGVPLTVCVDVVAASGGYLMSLPAHRIIAAPFAVVGSVGVVAFIPNVRDFLTNYRIRPRTFTAGKYKRTVTLTDNATPEEVGRFQNQLDSIHRLFQDAVKKYRVNARLEEVETGEHWTAQESMEKSLGLVDELGTSQSYLLKRNRDFDLLELSQKKNFWEDGFANFSARFLDALEERLHLMRFGI